LREREIEKEGREGAGIDRREWRMNFFEEDAKERERKKGGT